MEVGTGGMKQATQGELENVSADQAPEDLSLLQVMGSVFAASFGVQSRENKIRDFSRGKPIHFVIAGITFTVAFLFALVALVNLIV